MVLSHSTCPWCSPWLPWSPHGASIMLPWRFYGVPPRQLDFYVVHCHSCLVVVGLPHVKFKLTWWPAMELEFAWRSSMLSLGQMIFVLPISLQTCFWTCKWCPLHLIVFVIKNMIFYFFCLGDGTDETVSRARAGQSCNLGIDLNRVQ